MARDGTDATIHFRRPVSRPADGILVPARSRHRIERHSLRVELGRKVAEQRRRRGWSQPELAHRLSKPASWVSRLERGIADRGSLPVLHILPGPKGHTTDDIVSPDSPDGRHVQALQRSCEGGPSTGRGITASQSAPLPPAARWPRRSGNSPVAGRYDELVTLIGDLYATARTPATNTRRSSKLVLRPLPQDYAPPAARPAQALHRAEG